MLPALMMATGGSKSSLTDEMTTFTVFPGITGHENVRSTPAWNPLPVQEKMKHQITRKSIFINDRA